LRSAGDTLPVLPPNPTLPAFAGVGARDEPSLNLESAAPFAPACFAFTLAPRFERRVCI
jgi:hypothetical protein